MRKLTRVFSVLIIALIVFVSILTGYYYINLPDDFYITRGNCLKINAYFNICSYENELYKQSSVSVDEVLQTTVQLKLFGLIPIKEVSVKPTDRVVLVPGGNPFGIKLQTEGVLVIGITDVDSNKGNFSPAEECGIKAGDVVLEVNGEEITSNQGMAEAIMKSSGKKMDVTINRDGKIIEVDLIPRYSLSEGAYRAGMWVRDSSAGIGTITFYDPQTGCFGGLGHPVCDSETGEILPLHSGSVTAVTISDFKKGISGNPGELMGTFISGNSTGKLYINNNTGVFGTLDNAPNLSAPLQIAFRQEVKTGPAKILTTIKGNTPIEYDIEIEKINLSKENPTKNMVIRITDESLIEQTGGIIQGMSGSPIIQDGRLVGAVTHVFVNNPEKGYGIFIENMYDSVEKLPEYKDVA